MKTKGKRKFSIISKPPDKRDTLTRELIHDLHVDDVNEDTLFKKINLNSVLCDHDRTSNKKSNCKKYCRCIECLGNDVWEKTYEKLVDEEEGNNITLRSIQEKPCGLNNTGNHCYVNSFIQIWFSYIPFREAVYNFLPIEDFTPKDLKINIQEIIMSLKKLFITMQITPFEEACALPLITLLKLDNEQNDALEFTTLFFSTLERELGNHPNGVELKTLLQTCLTGRQQRTLVCSCGHESERSEEISNLHLSIEDVKTLPMAIKNYFQTEKLEDFKCSSCQKSGFVEKKLKLIKIPPVLLIQLNRVSYDASGRNVKVKTAIQYPRVMKSSMINEDLDDDIEYELFAVMIHEGKETHCGHYYDIIKDPSSGKWFKYNDRVVEEVKAPGYIDEPSSKTKSDMKGCYALLYKVKNDNEPVPQPEDNLRCKIEEELNELFKIEKEGTVSDKLWRYVFKKYYEQVKTIWRNLKSFDKIVDKKDFVWFPTDVLKEFNSYLHELYGKKQTVPEEMKTIEDYDKLEEIVYKRGDITPVSFELCCHRKIYLELILSGKMKAVSKEAAQGILSLLSLNVFSSKDYSEYISNELPTVDEICYECIRILIRRIENENGLEATEKLLKKLNGDINRRMYGGNFITTPYNGELADGYWISRDDFRNYRKLAMLSIGEKFKVNDSTYLMIFTNDISNIMELDDVKGESNSPIEEEQYTKKPKVDLNLDTFSDLNLGTQEKLSSLIFNESLKCEHGHLSIKKKRFYVTESEWKQLIKPFSNFYEVPFSKEECSDCTSIQSCEDLRRQNYASKIGTLKQTLGPMARTIENRDIMNNGSYSLGICKRFLKNIINYKSCDRVDEISGICQECVLCEEHNKPFLSPGIKKYEEMLAPIDDVEWTMIKAAVLNVGFLEEPKKISLTQIDNEEDFEFCQACNSKEFKDQENSRYIYPEGGTVYIRVSKADECDKIELSRFGRRSRKNELALKMLSTETIFQLKYRIGQEIRCDPLCLQIFKKDEELKNLLTLEESKVPHNNEDFPLQAIINNNNGGQDIVFEERPIEKGFKDTVLGF
uniref:ubiquitinyl hydrolase 1 n=1 Tax=Parastrongyloides trichosuri TaxID=131310 RepID=A0A0N4ZN35_PARTI